MNIHIDGHHNNNKSPKIVINATKISADDSSAMVYEFVLNINLNLVACSSIQSVSQARMKLINDFSAKLEGDLFELNHVRVDPSINNELILFRFKKALQNSGIEVKSPPDEILMAICYKPLGEISDVVRFYVKPDNSLVFLSKSVKLHSV